MSLLAENSIYTPHTWSAVLCGYDADSRTGGRSADDPLPLVGRETAAPRSTLLEMRQPEQLHD